MKTLLIIIFGSFIFVSFNFAQARKSDEFGISFSHELQRRISDFAVDLANDSKSFGQILVYREEKDTPGFSYKIGAAINSLLTFRSATEKSRIIITPCKTGQNRRAELWIVPKLEELRTCENDLLNLTKTTLFDSIYYAPEFESCCLVDDYGEEQYKASLEAFANILKNNPNSKAYIFFYLGTNVYNYNEKNVRKLDSPKLMKEMSKKAKKILTENGVDNSRIVLINGGYKDSSRNIELYFVPQNGKIPKPKPNYFPKRIKERK